MKKILLSFAILTVMILALASVSATVPVCATVETTYVSGTITDQTNGNAPVSGANVVVDCHGVIKNAVSDINGGYSVQYLASECDNGDDVSVSASYDSLSGSSDSVAWYTENTQIGCLELIVNVACADVPLVPEFGIAIGTLTVLCAIGIFFFVRKK
jgi:type 1 fimbria pilin